jgi:hypothetical protein
MNQPGVCTRAGRIGQYLRNYLILKRLSLRSVTGMRDAMWGSLKGMRWSMGTKHAANTPLREDFDDDPVFCSKEAAKRVYPS